mgnify:CR=1 FL=1
MKKILLVLLVSLGLQTQAQQANPYFCCDSITYWTDQGNGLSVGQIMTTDTIKVCYDVFLYESNLVETCSRCDSLVFDQNTYSWVLFSMGNPVGIEELIKNEDTYNIMYDLQGRKINLAPVGTMYIRNNKKYIRVN